MESTQKGTDSSETKTCEITLIKDKGISNYIF